MWLDITISIPLLWGIYIGYKKGLVSQVLGVISLFLGIWIGTNHGDWIYFLIEEKVDIKYLPIVSFAILFVATVIIGLLLAKGIEKMLAFIQLKQLNKLGGVIFGLIKVLLLMTIFTLIILSSELEEPEESDELEESDESDELEVSSTVELLVTLVELKEIASLPAESWIA